MRKNTASTFVILVTANQAAIPVTKNLRFRRLISKTKQKRVLWSFLRRNRLLISAAGIDRKITCKTTNQPKKRQGAFVIETQQQPHQNFVVERERHTYTQTTPSLCHQVPVKTLYLHNRQSYYCCCTDPACMHGRHGDTYRTRRECYRVWTQRAHKPKQTSPWCRARPAGRPFHASFVYVSVHRRAFYFALCFWLEIANVSRCSVMGAESEVIFPRAYRNICPCAVFLGSMPSAGCVPSSVSALATSLSFIRILVRTMVNLNTKGSRSGLN